MNDGTGKVSITTLSEWARQLIQISNTTNERTRSEEISGLIRDILDTTTPRKVKVEDK